jgi:hypothetical protein
MSNKYNEQWSSWSYFQGRNNDTKINEQLEELNLKLDVLIANIDMLCTVILGKEEE